MNASAAANPPGDADRTRALLASARPLVALATQLQHATPADPPRTVQALAAAVARFERDAQAAGCTERDVAAASYLLCVWLDEVVAHTPWGGDGAGLLARFHGEHDGSEKVLRLLSRLAEKPDRNRPLLELFHACLSLGLQGRWRGAAGAPEQLEALRGRVHLALRGDARGPALAPPWHSAVPPSRAWRWRRQALAGLLLLALSALGVYTASHLALASRVDAVFASMQRFSPAASPPPAPSAAQPAVARLAPLLAEAAGAGRLAVRDEAHRSVITLAADALFERDSARVAEPQVGMLEQVAAALAGKPGKVLVIGHTDGTDARSARVPSAWHQSFEWARAVSDALGKRLAPERLAAEGAADLDTGRTPRRRVEIVLYPSGS